MRHILLLVLACLACASGEFVEIYAEDEASPLFQAGKLPQDEFRTPQDEFSQQLAEQQQQDTEELSLAAEEPLTDTLYIMDDSAGSYRVTGMFQNVQMEQGNEQPINQLLERPRISFFDLSWSNWVDERLQILDLVQDLLVSSGSRCPHMQTESSSFDTGMVSYLASSRFGPAILTTYAQKIHEADDFDFDYDDVHISESAMSKSYEDASLLEDLSLNANQAFQEAEQESRSLFQQDNLGFFAANLKSDQALYQSQLDGEFESVQPSLKVPVSYFTRWDGFDDSDEDMMQQQYGQEENTQLSSDHLTNCVIFVMLLVGCVYVWTSLAQSCYSTFSEASQRKREQRSTAYSLAQKELLAPLNPEKAEAMPLVETAALETPEGTYYHAHGTGFEKVLVPLSKSPV